MAAVIGNLYTLNAPQLQQALDQIGPLSLASMRGLGIVESDVQSRTIDRRLATLASGPGAAAPAGWAAGRVAGPDSPWGFFASGVGGNASLDKFTDDSQVSLHTGGLLTGFDYSGEHFTAGVSGGYFSGSSKVNSLDRDQRGPPPSSARRTRKASATAFTPRAAAGSSTGTPTSESPRTVSPPAGPWTSGTSRGRPPPSPAGPSGTSTRTAPTTSGPRRGGRWRPRPT